MNNDLHLFIGFNKKDEDQRTVAGYASTPTVDSQGEIVEREAIEKALPGYLGEIDPNTGKHRYGNIREMHQLSAVGKTIKAKVDEKGLYIEGKVIDDNAWKKVKEGVYAGFSIGGKVLSAVKNRIKSLKLTEISLVDRPANPEAVFAMVKIDERGKTMDTQSQVEPTEIIMDLDNEVLTVGTILDIARHIRLLLGRFQQEGRSTYELSTALTSLKNLASKILSGDDKKKFDKILYEIDFKEINKLTNIENVRKNNDSKKNIEMYINTTWTPGYFEQLKKALG